MDPISDFTGDEQARVEALLARRYGKPVAIQLADSELLLDPGSGEMTTCPTLYWTARGAHFVVFKLAEGRYRCQFFYTDADHYGTGRDQYADLDSCVSTLLQVQAGADEGEPATAREAWLPLPRERERVGVRAPQGARAMAKKEYAFYPGCSSQLGASASNYVTSVKSMCKTLDVKLTEIPDWNCCGASIGYCEGSELPRLAINARNFALAETHLPGQDIVATCAACWLGARETKDRLNASAQLMKETNEALAAAGLHYKAEVEIKHMVEVLIEDFGYEELKKPVVKPLRGIKFAGYVGCQTNRPFGIDGESFENPVYLDRMVETVGGEALDNYDQKVTCCGGALAFSEPDKSQKQIRDIVASAYDHGAEMIVTPCPLCQANVEVYQAEINRKQGTKFNMPVLYSASSYFRIIAG